MAKFIAGIEWFRRVKEGAGHFVKGVAFAGGAKFPLVRGEIKGKIEKDVLNFTYAVKK